VSLQIIPFLTHESNSKVKKAMAVDILSLIGVVGTWLAVFLAILALVGIVGPLLVLKAFYSERNQALNSIRDVNGDFISRGIGFGRSFRILHRVKVPRLVPEVDWDDLDSFRIPSTETAWTLGSIEGTTCRTGWARLCKLLSAYDVPQAQGGDLVIKENETTLPVSKYYILSIGLLGRYGNRDDGGKVFNLNPLRPDLRQLRILAPARRRHQHLGAIGRRYSSDSESDQYGSDTSVESVHKNRRPRTNLICGVTGEFRIKKDFTLMDFAAVEEGFSPTTSGMLLQFILNNDEEMGFREPVRLSNDDASITAGDSEKPQRPLATPDLALGDLYWLASGFLPLSTRTGFIACLQTPPGIVDLLSIPSASSDLELHLYSDTDSESSFSGRGSLNQKSNPSRSSNSSPALAEADTTKDSQPSHQTRRENHIYERSPHGASARPRPPRRKSLRREKITFKDWTTIELLETQERPISIYETSTAFGMSSTRVLMFQSTTKQRSENLVEVSQLQALAAGDTPTGKSKWILWRPRWGRKYGPIFLRRKDVQMLVCEMLAIEWHPWSFLIWKQNNDFWIHTMRGAARYLNTVKTCQTLKSWKKSPKGWEAPWVGLLNDWLRFSGKNIATYEQRRHAVLLKLHRALAKELSTNGSGYVLAVLFISNQHFRESLWTEWDYEMEWDAEKRVVSLVHNPENQDSNSDADDGNNEIPVHVNDSIDVHSRGHPVVVQRGEAEVRLEFEYEDVFPSKFDVATSKEIVKIEDEAIFISITWAATCCALWTSAINSAPLMGLVDGLDDVINVV
jgi:hypothetical protein